MKERWPDCPIVIGREEAPKLTSAALNLSAGFGGTAHHARRRTCLLDEGEVYTVAGFDFEARMIPGHSSGHMVFIGHELRPILVFGGDVLFAGSIGRTDFPDGSFDALADGIHRSCSHCPTTRSSSPATARQRPWARRRGKSVRGTRAARVTRAGLYRRLRLSEVVAGNAISACVRRYFSGGILIGRGLDVRARRQSWRAIRA